MCFPFPSKGNLYDQGPGHDLHSYISLAPMSSLISSFHFVSSGVSKIRGIFATSFRLTMERKASFPMSPSPMLSCLSLFEERGTLESLRCMPKSLSSPKREEKESKTPSG